MTVGDVDRAEAVVVVTQLPLTTMLWLAITLVTQLFAVLICFGVEADVVVQLGRDTEVADLTYPHHADRLVRCGLSC